MIRFPRLNNRQIVLATWAVLFVVSATLIDRYIFPAYEELDSERALAKSQAIHYLQLTRNLAISKNVNMEFEGLGKSAQQTENDQITLSNFLRDLETLARLPNMTIVNIKPLPIKTKPTHKIYRAKLSVAGRLQDILQFVLGVSSASMITGLESFYLRGVQGGVSKVECSLLVRMIRLISESQTDEPWHERQSAKNGGPR